MTSSRTSVLVVALALVVTLGAGCSGPAGTSATDAALDVAPADLGVALDAPSGDDAGSDVGAGDVDGGGVDGGDVDAGSALDAGSAPDAADAATVTCNTGLEAPMPVGICDGRGMVGCTMWAQANAGSADGYAICLQVGIGGCARADACTDARVPSTCTCAGGPACEPGAVCTSAGCRCISAP